MNSINRFFAPKKAPATAKASAGKKEAAKAASEKSATTGGSPSSFDSMDEAPHKEKKATEPMPRSALKKSKTIALSDGAQMKAVASRRPSANAAEANKSFDGHYGDSKSHEADAAPRQAKYTFKEDAVKERIEFSRYEFEQPHIKGQLANLYAEALKRKSPILGFDDIGKVMIWPSGHTYRGAYEKNGGRPGPVGQLTLPSGHKLQAWFKDGSCYLAKDSEGEVVDPKVDKVITFRVH